MHDVYSYFVYKKTRFSGLQDRHVRNGYALSMSPVTGISATNQHDCSGAGSLPSSPLSSFIVTFELVY
ncbi:hypothetical protein DDI_1918 [Dickeya dianthicola RNS04.9]|nr:hypothetical protein DDI_1918 [Dickeya dianthicola RNS04.9]